jgi:hypothetical protein
MQPDTRTSSYTVYGNTADELEAEALKEARKDFGPGIKLAVDRSYELVHKVPMTSIVYPTGTHLTASIRVRIIDGVNPADPPPPSVLERWYRRWLA